MDPALVGIRKEAAAKVEVYRKSLASADVMNRVLQMLPKMTDTHLRAVTNEINERIFLPATTTTPTA